MPRRSGSLPAKAIFAWPHRLREGRAARPAIDVYVKWRSVPPAPGAARLVTSAPWRRCAPPMRSAGLTAQSRRNGMREPMRQLGSGNQEDRVVTGTVPIKTPDGQAELSTRARRLSQRHRTVLFLVDGKRSAVEVRSLASKAGVPDTCFDELLELGLIMLPPPTFSVLIGNEPGAADTLHVDLPLSGPNSVSAL